MGKVFSYFFLSTASDIVIKVRTGDRAMAGTDANVKIVLIDTEGNWSSPITLDNPFIDDFQRGSEDEFHVKPKKVLGLSSFCEFDSIEVRNT